MAAAPAHDERLDMVCIHATSRFMIEWLSD
jgi:hypothetical protein